MRLGRSSGIAKYLSVYNEEAGYPERLQRKGRFCVARDPTGYGKSVCLPISPLVSLMVNQVSSLRSRGVPAVVKGALIRVCWPLREI